MTAKVATTGTYTTRAESISRAIAQAKPNTTIFACQGSPTCDLADRADAMSDDEVRAETELCPQCSRITFGDRGQITGYTNLEDHPTTGEC